MCSVLISEPTCKVTPQEWCVQQLQHGVWVSQHLCADGRVSVQERAPVRHTVMLFQHRPTVGSRHDCPTAAPHMPPSALCWFVAVVLSGTVVSFADCVYRPLSRLSRLRDQAGSPARQSHCPATLLDDEPCGPWQQEYAALHADIVAGTTEPCKATAMHLQHFRPANLA